MAKGKHAAALFEVIHAARKNDMKPVLATPKWWWKRNRSNVVTSTSMFASPGLARHNPDEYHASPDDPTQSHPMALAADAHASPHTIVHSQPLDEPSDASPTASAAPAMDVALDAERKLITFKFSYNSAIISAFAVVVVVLLAYIVGRKVNTGPTPVMATETTAQLRSKPARPDVLNVGPGAKSNAPLPQHVEPDTGTSSRTADAMDVEAGKGAAPAAGQEGPAPLRDRELGLNYVVVQSYPDEKSAIDARDALTKAGVPCTIEQKLRGLNATWHTVVGLKGFPRASGEEYDAYLAKISQVSATYAKSKRSFKAFQPIAYKWDKPTSTKAVG